MTGSGFFHDLTLGFDQQFAHFPADRIGISDIAQITGNLAHDVLDTGLFEIRFHDFFCIVISIFAGFSQQLGGPEAQQLVAAYLCLERHLFVMGVFVLKGVFAVVKGRHGLVPEFA